MLESMPDLPSTITRLGHILAGGRQKRFFDDAIGKVIDQIFDFRLVQQLPPEHAAWRESAAWVLQASACSMDLSPIDIENILAHANGRWQDARYTHWCLGSRCPSGCRDAAHSKQLAKDLAKVSLPGCPLALLYRWKHMDRALGFLARGVAQNGLLPRALRLMWSQQAVDQAAAEAENALSIDELPYTTKTTVKAGAVLRYFHNHPDSMDVYRCLVLMQPLQIYLNQVMKADSACEKLGRALAVNPASEETADLQKACQKLNYKFVSGMNGKRVVAAYSAMILNLLDERWYRKVLGEESILECALMAIRSAAAALDA